MPACAAFALVTRLFREFAPTPANRALRAILSLGIGIGLSSCTFFVWMVLSGRPGAMYIIIDSLLWFCTTIACLAGFRARTLDTGVAVADVSGSQPSGWRSAGSRLIRPVTCLFAIVLVGALAGLFSQALAHPEGSWDAWAIWNLRARFLFRAADDWRLALAGAIDLPDYPLLLPASLARVWTLLGDEAPWAGPSLAIVFTLLTTALLVAAVTARRGVVSGLLAGMVLLGTVRYLRWGAAQYADVPLSFFFLATLAVLMIDGERSSQGGGKSASGPFRLAGLLAALSAWTKNEGLVFMVVVFTVRAVVTARQSGVRRAAREAFAFLAGAGPVLLLIFFLKSHAAHRNLLIAGQGLTETTARLFDPARHATIALTILGSIVQVIHAFAIIIPVSFLLLGKHRHAGNGPHAALWPAGVIGLMLAAYYGIYLTTPLELKAHLATSIDRLIVQLWPMAIFAIFMNLRSPAEVLAPAIARELPSNATVIGLSEQSRHAEARSRAA